MIRQSRERPLGELELLIRPLKNKDHESDSEDAYDNGLLTINPKNPLEQSLETLRDDLTTGYLIEQYEVRFLDFMENQILSFFLDTSTKKRRFYFRNWD